MRQAAGQAVPAILVTAQRAPELARASHAIDVPLLEKPVRPEDLAAMLQQMLA